MTVLISLKNSVREVTGIVAELIAAGELPPREAATALAVLRRRYWIAREKMEADLAATMAITPDRDRWTVRLDQMRGRLRAASAEHQAAWPAVEVLNERVGYSASARRLQDANENYMKLVRAFITYRSSSQLTQTAYARE